MKLQKTFLLLIFLFISLQVCFGQEDLKTVKFDEFGETNCDDISARIDNLYITLNNAPQTKGFIVIYGNNKEPTKKYLFAEMLKGFINFLKADVNRFVFRFGESENFKTQFWIIPNGETFVLDQEIKYPQLPNSFKPLIVHKNSDFTEICPDKFNYKVYSDLLQANSNVNANIVIYEKSLGSFYKTEKNLLNELAKKYNVSESQIKFFYVKRHNSDVEFWLVPRKKK